VSVRPTKRKRLMSDINVVPYIDVMLVLLIIFMVTAPLLTQGIKVELPKAGAEPLPQQDETPLILSVDSGGRFYLSIGDDQKAPIEDDVVIARVATVLRRRANTPVLVKADTSVPYGRVVTGMVLLQKAGAEKVGFITDPQDLQPASSKKR
jgi:biopolymer transport protein TolR